MFFSLSDMYLVTTVLGIYKYISFVLWRLSHDCSRCSCSHSGSSYNTRDRCCQLLGKLWNWYFVAAKTRCWYQYITRINICQVTQFRSDSIQRKVEACIMRHLFESSFCKSKLVGEISSLQIFEVMPSMPCFFF